MPGGGDEIWREVFPGKGVPAGGDWRVKICNADFDLFFVMCGWTIVCSALLVFVSCCRNVVVFK